MHKTFLVARHEFRQTAGNIAFLLMTLLGPFLLIGISVVPSLLMMNPQVLEGKTTIVLVSPPQELTAVLQDSLDPKVHELRTVATLEEGTALLSDSKVKFLLDFPLGWPQTGAYGVLSANDLDYPAYAPLREAINNYVVDQRLLKKGIGAEEARLLLAPVQTNVRSLKAQASAAPEEYLGRMLLTVTFLMLIYMSVLLYGTMIGRSVVTEKASKTVEMILSAVSSRDWMIGKILGMGAAGILQYLVWITVMVAGLAWASQAFPSFLPPFRPNLGYFLPFITFLLGFFLYASMMAAVASVCDDEAQFNQALWPLMIPLMVPMFVFNAILSSPYSTFSTVLTWFPLTSPTVLIVRALNQSIEPWELVGSLVLLALTVVFTMILSARIFRVGLLMTGKSGWKDWIRWAFQK